MELFRRQSPMKRELEILSRKEVRFLANRQNQKESILNQKLAKYVPEKLQQTLDGAFSKAFLLVFEKGTGVIEKTYRREEMEKNFQIQKYANEVKQNHKTLKTFSKKAGLTGSVNTVLSGGTGVAMGVLGIGIPDIPVLTGIMLKSIYEIALSFGFEYESEEERYFILLLIQGAVSYGDPMCEINHQVDDFIEREQLPDGYEREAVITQTAGILSKELLYMKFLQGIPIVGAIGGLQDAVYLNRITEYAKIKYQKRFFKNLQTEGKDNDA